MSDMKKPKIGEELIQKELISEKILEKGLEYQAKEGGRLGDVLVNHGLISEYEISAYNRAKAEDQNRLGSRLVAAGLISEENLDEALQLQKDGNQQLGDVLVENGFISRYDLSLFIQHNQFSKIGEILINSGLISQKQLDQAITIQKQTGGRLGNICVSEGFISEEKLNEALSQNIRSRMKLGESLLTKGLITQTQLNRAVDLQQVSGGRLGEILLFLGMVDTKTLARELANQFELGLIGNDEFIDEKRDLPYSLAYQDHAFISARESDRDIVVSVEPLNPKRIESIEKLTGKKVENVLASPEEFSVNWTKKYGDTESYRSVFDLFDKYPEKSALMTFSKKQLIIVISVGILLIVGVLFNWRRTLFFLNIFFQIIYTAMTILKLIIVMKGEQKTGQQSFTAEDVAEIDEKKLPVYTVLLPVFHEKNVVKSLVEYLDQMDYPKQKLDIIFLLEEKDIETIETLRNLPQPHHFSIVVVPPTIPQTKPKACNYGLLQAKGEYVVIYDAEDRPELDQLKKAWLAFQRLPDNYVCVQSKLNYYNSVQNVMTRLFTQEYSMWFENLLIGVMGMDTPVPLGGTSNHFKLEALRQTGGWDPFNVTEDADLGVRIFTFGYKTAVLDSRTWEEATSNIHSWLRQRSRWLKGYMQTWLVHMRHPVQLYKELGLRGFIGYQGMVLGTPLLPLINPFFWFLMIFWFMTKASWIQYMFPGFFYFAAAIQFIFGNFMFTYTNVIGMYSVERDCNLRKTHALSYGIIKYALFTPIYWMLMSIAAYKGLFQLIRNPFYWEKTRHGMVNPEKVDQFTNKKEMIKKTI